MRSDSSPCDQSQFMMAFSVRFEPTSLIPIELGEGVVFGAVAAGGEGAVVGVGAVYGAGAVFGVVAVYGAGAAYKLGAG